MSKYIPSPCTDWEEKIAATHPNDLSAFDRKVLEKHVESCSECANTLKQYLRMNAQLRCSSSIEPLPGLPPQLLKIWAKQDHQEASHKPLFAPFSYVLMAYSVVVTGIGMYVIYRNSLRLPIWPVFDKVQISNYPTLKGQVKRNMSRLTKKFRKRRTDDQTIKMGTGPGS